MLQQTVRVVVARPMEKFTEKLSNSEWYLKVLITLMLIFCIHVKYLSPFMGI